MPLDSSSDELKKMLLETVDKVTELYDTLRERKVYQAGDPEDVRKMFSESMPLKASNFSKILKDVQKKVIDTATLNIHPCFFAYFTGPASFAALPAELLAAALNQNNLKWHCSPPSTEMERQVIRWIAEFIGYKTDCGGVLLSGGSMANLTCLAVARQVKAKKNISEHGLYESTPMVAYVSTEGHSSIDKSFDMLGLGKKYLRKIPVTDDFKIDLWQLELMIEKDREVGLQPFCVTGIAGNTNMGAVDPLEDIAEICKKHKLWFHVDAAYGGPVADVESKKELFAGMEHADSIVVDPHKWNYIPFEAGAALVKNPQHLRDTFSLLPDYLKQDVDRSKRFDYMEYSYELTRNFRALKVWMTFMLYGADKLKKNIENDIAKAERLKELVDKSKDFERLAPVPLSVVCFRFIDKKNKLSDEELDALNTAILKEIERDGRIFLTGTKIHGKVALRAACINHRTNLEDIKFMLKVIKEIGESILEKNNKA